MRLLHTSDWHLGVSHGPTSRGPDHDHFFAWLEQQVETLEVDALIVAGDVFDTMQPSSEAQARYYAFLSRIAASGLPQTLIVGGNHDSASRLDAPAEVLASLRVHVVGGLNGGEETWDRCVIPLVDRAGTTCAVALAVPYVHEFRLGVRTTDLDRAGVRAAFEDKFRDLYRWLADRAEERFPGLPIVATGHLTLGSASRDDYPQEIHQVGTIDGLPSTILDARIRYAALGHIHRSYPVDHDRRAWYSGSPIAFSLPEARTPRRVLLVDLEDTLTVTPIEVPNARALKELRGSTDSVLQQIATLRWEEPLPPLLFCRFVDDHIDHDLARRLHETLIAFDEARRPAIAEVRHERPNASTAVDEPAPLDLRSLSPVTVFETLCQSRGYHDRDDLVRAFTAIESATEDDFQAMLEQTRSSTP